MKRRQFLTHAGVGAVGATALAVTKKVTAAEPELEPEVKSKLIEEWKGEPITFDPDALGFEFFSRQLGDPPMTGRLAVFPALPNGWPPLMPHEGVWDTAFQSARMTSMKEKGGFIHKTSPPDQNMAISIWGDKGCRIVIDCLTLGSMTPADCHFQISVDHRPLGWHILEHVKFPNFNGPAMFGNNGKSVISNLPYDICPGKGVVLQFTGDSEKKLSLNYHVERVYGT